MLRAREKAAMQLLRVDHTMRLENQAVDKDEFNNAREQLARNLAENPRRLWEAMTDLLVEDDGGTPLEHEELEHLVPAYITSEVH